MAPHLFPIVQSPPFLTVPSPLFYPRLTGNGGRDGTTCAVRFILVEPRGPENHSTVKREGCHEVFKTRTNTEMCHAIGDRVLKSAERECLLPKYSEPHT